MSLVSLINFPVKGDERGSLIALEANDTIPFEIKRVYYIFDTKEGVARGFHAHKNLKQVLIAVSGFCTILLDDSTKKEEIVLNSSAQGLLIDSFIWREMYNFSKDCVLLVLASDHYNESDYIRNYDDFRKMVNI